MINQPGEILHLTLVDLVASTPGAAEHDIHAFDAVRDESDKFADGGSAVEFLLFDSFILISNLPITTDT